MTLNNDPDPDRVIPLDITFKRVELGTATPAQSAEVLHFLTHQPLPDGISAPEAPIGPIPVAIPEAYVIHNHSQRCLACNSQHRWNEIYTLHMARSRWDARKVRHLTPAKRLDWNVPLDVVEVPTVETPFCFECLDATRDYVKSLPKPPVPQAVLRPTIASSSNPSSRPAEAQAKPKRPRIVPFTSSDDLMS